MSGTRYPARKCGSSRGSGTEAPSLPGSPAALMTLSRASVGASSSPGPLAALPPNSGDLRNGSGWLVTSQENSTESFLTGFSCGQGSKRWNLKLVILHVPLRCKKVRNSIIMCKAAFSDSGLAKPPRKQNRHLPPAARLWISAPSAEGWASGSQWTGRDPSPGPCLAQRGVGVCPSRPNSSEALRDSASVATLGPDAGSWACTAGRWQRGPGQAQVGGRGRGLIPHRHR